MASAHSPLNSASGSTAWHEHIATSLAIPDALPQATVRDGSDLVLGTLLASKADYLITGDKDLLALAGQYPAIVTSAEFWRKHGS